MSKYKFGEYERWAVYMAHDGRCPWCGEHIEFKNVNIDHLIAESTSEVELAEQRSRFGLDDEFDVNSYENWVPACGHCNRQKGATEYDGTVMLHRLNVAKKRVGEARKIEERMKRDAKKAKLLVTIELALESGEVEREDFLELLTVSGSVADVEADATFSVGDLSATLYEGRWTIVDRVDHNPDIVTVSDGGKVGTVNLNPDADVSYWCPTCLRAGVWNGARCMRCGQLSDD